MQNNFGINECMVDKLILDIYSHAERINKTLTQISDIVFQTENFYICESATNYRRKYNSFTSNYTIINKNIISYADDLVKLKGRFESINVDAAMQIKSATMKIESKDYRG